MKNATVQNFIAMRLQFGNPWQVNVVSAISLAPEQRHTDDRQLLQPAIGEFHDEGQIRVES